MDEKIFRNMGVGCAASGYSLGSSICGSGIGMGEYVFFVVVVVVIVFVSMYCWESLRARVFGPSSSAHVIETRCFDRCGRSAMVFWVGVGELMSAGRSVVGRGPSNPKGIVCRRRANVSCQKESIERRTEKLIIGR